LHYIQELIAVAKKNCNQEYALSQQAREQANEETFKDIPGIQELKKFEQIINTTPPNEENMLRILVTAIPPNDWREIFRKALKKIKVLVPVNK
jgi:hypothetical protein